MSDNKDNNYNDSSKNDALKGQKFLFGFESIPGEQYQSTTVCTKCPTCGYIGATQTTATWSMKSCLCLYCCGGYWGCWQLLNGKDFIPKDCVHKCGKPGCPVELAHYKSCDKNVNVTDSSEK